VKLTLLTEEARSFAANPLVAFLVPSKLVVVAPRPNLALRSEGGGGYRLLSFPADALEGCFFFFFCGQRSRRTLYPVCSQSIDLAVACMCCPRLLEGGYNTG